MSAVDPIHDTFIDELPTSPDVASSTEATLLEMVLGIPGIAPRVLALHGLLELGRLSPVALAERVGIALGEATRLAAAFELGQRCHAARVRRPTRLRTARDVARFFQPRLGPLVHEEVWLAALDSYGGVRGVRMVTRGGLTGGYINTGDIFRAAIEMAAVTFALAHNHPSGNPKPSEADLHFTNALIDGGRIIGLDMLAHVVVTASDRWAVIEER